MMQSRVALGFRGSSPRSLGRQLHRSWSRAATINTTAAGAGDPAVHAALPQGEDAELAVKSVEAEQQRRRERLVREGGERESPLQPTVGGSTNKSSSFTTAPKLEGSEVPPPAGPAFQQKRKLRIPGPALEDVSCVGWDGRPLKGGAGGSEEQQQEQTKDYKEYFDHHKPTPLSGLEFADTRRPIRRATDSDVVDDDAGIGEEPRGWREEQEDTVDAALLRAEAMFRAAAERGDPDTPHGRVLANYQRLVLL